MSLGKTLLKVAIGVAIVKGMSSLTKGGTATPEVPAGRTTGRGTPYDGQTAGRSPGQTGGLEDLLKDVLGSGGRARSGGVPQDDAQQGSGGGGLGDLLDQLSGQKRSSPRATAPKGGLDDLLGQLTGGRSATERASPDLSLGRGPDRGTSQGGVGDLLDQVLGNRKPGAPVELAEPEREAELSAALMLRAVIQAVKCDGDLDDNERQRLTQAMGDADQREVQAVNAELQRPLDVKGLARAVPAGLEPQVYLVSLMAINLDQKAEAEYLHQLAGELDLSPDQVNAIHDKAGAPRLYR
ncbi:MAG: hypothetical protein FD152_659 [Xanthobacteraceae bacterium]|nr:MAG: hypothetical protein FD152_659 [Xanthobacteraceae bacterium]